MTKDNSCQLGYIVTPIEEIKVNTQCGNCGEIVAVSYNAQLGNWRATCTNKDCQMGLYVEIQIPRPVFVSDNQEVKTCFVCKKRWVRSHTCNLQRTFSKEEIVIDQ